MTRSLWGCAHWAVIICTVLAMSKPAYYLVRQRGLSRYSEVHRFRKHAVEAARDMLWHPGRVEIVPLFAGRPVPVEGKRSLDEAVFKMR